MDWTAAKRASGAPPAMGCKVDMAACNLAMVPSTLKVAASAFTSESIPQRRPKRSQLQRSRLSGHIVAASWMHLRSGLRPNLCKARGVSRLQ